LGFIGIADVQTVGAEAMNNPPIAPQAIPPVREAIQTLAI
jgi:FMN-dependent NADH-azoreductase